MLADALTPAEEGEPGAAAAEDEGADELLATTPLRLLQAVEQAAKRARHRLTNPQRPHSPRRRLSFPLVPLFMGVVDPRACPCPSSRRPRPWAPVSPQVAGDGEAAVAGQFAALLPGDPPSIFQGDAPVGVAEVLEELRAALLARVGEEEGGNAGEDEEGGDEFLSEVA